MLVTVLLVAFFGLLFIGVPISFSLSVSSFLAVAITGSIPVMTLVQKTFRAIDSFTLLAIPFFLFAGNVMARGGVSKRLTDMAATMVGRMPGGLAHITTLSSTFFGAISGSAPATTSAIGAELISGSVGVGPQISYYTEFMMVDQAFAYVYIMAAIGVVFYTLVNFCENLVLKNRK